MMTREFQLVLFPGLGTDARLFEPQRCAFPQLTVPTWIPPKKEETLPDYAARMAATLTPLRGVPLILGGVSLGGMMAYEVARCVKPDAVVQIASCHARKGLRRLFRAGTWLVPCLPVKTWSLAKVLAAPTVRLASRFVARDRSLAVTMFKEMDSTFMHWALGAILQWQPSKLEGVPVFQIHGRRDLLIPARLVDADEYIPDGGHLINVTHAEQVNAFIGQVAAKVIH